MSHHFFFIKKSVNINASQFIFIIQTIISTKHHQFKNVLAPPIRYQPAYRHQ